MQKNKNVFCVQNFTNHVFLESSRLLKAGSPVVLTLDLITTWTSQTGLQSVTQADWQSNRFNFGIETQKIKLEKDQTI